jgi:aminoglycoside phosphotransferase (APT) family kinase protein
VRAQGVPVAQVVQVLQPAHGLGEGFVMTRISRRDAGAQAAAGRQAFAAVRPRLAAQLGAALGHIHRVPLAALPPLPVVSTAATLAFLQAEQDALARPSAVFAFALRWLHGAPAARPRAGAGAW